MSYDSERFDGLEDIALEALQEETARKAADNNMVVFVKEPVWITEDGKAIEIRDMDTQHIKNCLHLIYRSNGNWRRPYIRLFKAELRKRKWSRSLREENKQLGRIVSSVLRGL